MTNTKSSPKSKLKFFHWDIRISCLPIGRDLAFEI